MSNYSPTVIEDIRRILAGTSVTHRIVRHLSSFGHAQSDVLMYRSKMSQGMMLSEGQMTLTLEKEGAK